MKKNNSRCIIVFVKAPVKGLVKTRLAGHIGEKDALLLYKAMASDILDAITHADCDLRIFYHPEKYRRQVCDWLGSDSGLLPQKGADLGSRMLNALSRTAAEGFDKILLVGSDIPELTTIITENAFTALKTHHAVIGPAMDGGYYLIGFSKSHIFKEAFTDIAWSSRDVYARTLKRLRKNGKTVHTIEPLRDIDTLEDLQGLASTLTFKSHCPHTFRVLAEIGLPSLTKHNDRV